MARLNFLSPDVSAIRRMDVPHAFLLADAILKLYLNITSGMIVFKKQVERRMRIDLPFMATEKLSPPRCAPVRAFEGPIADALAGQPDALPGGFFAAFLPDGGDRKRGRQQGGGLNRGKDRLCCAGQSTEVLLRRDVPRPCQDCNSKD